MDPPRSNSFSKKWYTLFSGPISSIVTVKEIEFIQRHAPADKFQRLFDLCCGEGRHATLLTKAGYRVLGIDNSESAVDHAKQVAPNAEIMKMDIRQLSTLPTKFDCCINLWQSFGYFDDETNFDILRSISAVLEKSGSRAIFDIYNRDYYQSASALEKTCIGGEVITTSREWVGNRLNVHLAYERGGEDSFDWHLYTPEEFCSLAAEAGLKVQLTCAWFNESTKPSDKHARHQYVFEKA